MLGDIVLVIGCVGAGFLAGIFFSGALGGSDEDERTIIVAPGQNFQLRSKPMLHKCKYCEGTIAFVHRKDLHDHVVNKHPDEIVREGGSQ